MVTRILESSSTTRRVLDYNEEKAMRGDATVVISRNLPGDDPISLYNTFNEYEQNPAIDERTRKLGFHMAVNPGPADKVTEEGVCQYIDELMKDLGYGEQPYVVYRHRDIDREHYHVVSVRVDRRGKVISDSFSGLRLMSIQKKLASKYGFTVGDSSLEAGPQDLLEKPVVFNPKAINQKQQILSLFTDALAFDYHSFYQFHCIMNAFGLKATLRKRKDEGYNMIVVGLDSSGKPATRPHSMEKHLKVRATESYDKRLAENNGVGYLKADRKVILLAISDYCREHSRSEAEYCALLDELGIGHTILRNEDTGEIRRVTLVEKSTIALADTGLSRELFLPAFTKMEKEGLWKKPVPGKQSKAVRKKNLFTPEMMIEMKELVDQRVALFRGVKPQARIGERQAQGRKLIKNM